MLFIAGVRGSRLKSESHKRSNTMNLASVTNRLLFYDRDQEVYAVFNHIVIGNKGMKLNCSIKLYGRDSSRIDHERLS